MEKLQGLKAIVGELIAQGADSKDAAAAGHLACAIASLDRMVFPGNGAPVSLESCWHERDSAQYRCSINGTEEYAVYISRLFEQVRAECLGTTLDRSYLHSDRQHPIPTMMEVIIGISVHEVRHRLQFQERATLRRFTPDMQRDHLVGTVLRQVQISDRWCTPAPTQTADLLPGPYQELEFDAMVVERYALHRMDVLENPQALADIVRLTP